MSIVRNISLSDPLKRNQVRVMSCNTLCRSLYARYEPLTAQMAFLLAFLSF
jgi:hypothetical protein